MSSPYPSGPPGPPPGPAGWSSGPYGPGTGEAPPSNLAYGIVTLLLCGGGIIGLVAGVVSVVQATRVSPRWAVGDQVGAREASRKARVWAVWGLVLSAALFLLIMVVVITLAATGVLDESTAAVG